MFFAHSSKNNCDLHISQVKDLLEIFDCVNPDCHAKLKAVSVESQKRAAHFRLVRGSQHAENCLYRYDFCSSEYVESADIIKSSLDDILNGPQQHKGSKSSRNYQGNIQHDSTRKNTYIRTANQLLRYCESNRLDTIYKDDMRIRDFFINRSTVNEYNSNSDVSGVKLLLGETHLYNSKSEKYIQIYVSDHKEKSIEARLYFNSEQFWKIINYIFNTFGPRNFSGHPIAVLGDWHYNRKEDLAETDIVKHSNIVYKFTQSR